MSDRAPISTEAESLLILRDLFQHWLDWQREQRAREGLTSEPDTHIICVPTEWPSRATVAKWIETIAAAAARLSAEPAPHGATSHARSLTCENCATAWLPRPHECPQCGHPASFSGEPAEHRIERKVRRESPEHYEYLAARFPPGGTVGNSFEWQGHRWAYAHTSFDDEGDFDLIYRPCPPTTKSGDA
jgi:hypothetical protein